MPPHTTHEYQPLDCSFFGPPGGEGESGDLPGANDSDGSPSNVHSTDAGSSTHQLDGTPSQTRGGEGDQSAGRSTRKENNLSCETEALYKRRYEEGYDIFNPDYVNPLYAKFAHARSTRNNEIICGWSEILETRD